MGRSSKPSGLNKGRNEKRGINWDPEAVIGRESSGNEKTGRKQFRKPGLARGRHWGRDIGTLIKMWERARCVRHLFMQRKMRLGFTFTCLAPPPPPPPCMASLPWLPFEAIDWVRVRNWVCSRVIFRGVLEKPARGVACKWWSSKPLSILKKAD